MSNFKKYRNKETGQILEGQLIKQTRGWLFQFKIGETGWRANGSIFLTKRHFKLNWKEVVDDKH